MDYGFIRKIVIISSSFFVILLFGCVKSNTIKINNDVDKFIQLQELDKCDIIELYEYHLGDSLKEIVNKSKYSIDQNQVTEYSINIVKNYEYIAYMYGKTLKEYYSDVMNISEDAFFEKCYNEGLYDVKYYLTIGAIAKRENLGVSESEYEKYVAQNEIQFDLKTDDQVRIKYEMIESEIKELFTEGE